ncbi:OLC1v1026982C1 [Oldenlandia corymbosa var. corymbosa]|uniref:OLC1v1026982C1 n=1 Tax=Oldenlandia corymbosa var. corymbosa TaxID=529605 RepID=A0AAV1C9M5_OLDCO|nr:OLC1v1026982C1 [Oldenlandia corymbosa var. corymbosa]
MAKSTYDDSSVLPEAVIWNILIWVPVKSLMRFKSVCKFWLSIIVDPSFARVYQGGFKGLLFIQRFSILSPFNPRDFFYLKVDDDDTRTHISHHYTLDQHLRMASTPPVNGLVCFYDGYFSCLYNIATRERMVLPDSDMESAFCVCHFGFDPSNEVYKVLKTCPSREVFIFTVAVDSSWRSIPFTFDKINLCGSYRTGVLYWTLPNVCHSEINYSLLCFDLTREEFQVISHPPGKWSYLLPFGPNLALSSSESCWSSQFKIISSKDDGHYIANGDCGQTSSLTWSEHVIDLPKQSESEKLYYFRPLGALNGNVVLMDFAASKWDFPVPFCVYDQAKGELKKRYIADCGSSSIAKQRIVDHDLQMIDLWYYEENIMPLSCLVSK